MFKKLPILQSYHNTCTLQSTGVPQSKTSPNRPLLQGRSQQACRSYAMVSDGQNSHNHGDLRWPEITSANRIPTPYQIFNQKKGSPYSKQRFIELVKLYHPDRHDACSTTGGLTYATKLERYRLVVAANEILSDAVKRSAFDLYGAGWNGMPHVKSPKEHCNSSAAAWADRDGGAWNEPGGPSRNATWEDWERWYARHDPKEKQVPQFVSNGAFVGLIVIFAIVGGIGQATRVGNFSVGFIEQRDALHDRIAKDLTRRRTETTSLFESREERIIRFLKQREPVGYEEIAQNKGVSMKLLPPPPEAQPAGNINKKQMDRPRIHNQKDG